jgi:magnesium transporter
VPTHSLNAADELLDLWFSLRSGQRVDRFEALPRELMDNFFLALDANAQSSLVRSLPEGERRLYMRLLAPDDAADVIQESPKRQRQYLLDLLDDKTRNEVRALLAFREDIAGGLMNPRFARLRPDASIDEAISYLRQQLGHVETIHYAYVLDEGQTLLGVVALKDLVAADPKKTVKDVMTTKIYSVSPNTDQSEIAHLLTQHGIKAVPVIDENRHMQGIVTADDLIDVLQEEDTEDIQKLGGMEALDGPYLETTFPAMIKKRAGWLVILFLGEMLTATAMSHFEHEIERAVVLSLHPLAHQQRRQFRFAGHFAHHPRFSSPGSPSQRLVARDPPRGCCRCDARHHPRDSRHDSHFDLAIHLAHLR